MVILNHITNVLNVHVTVTNIFWQVGIGLVFLRTRGQLNVNSPLSNRAEIQVLNSRPVDVLGEVA